MGISRRYLWAVSLCFFGTIGVIGVSCSADKDSSNSSQGLPLPTAESFKSSGKLKAIARSDLSVRIIDVDGLYDDRPEQSDPSQKCISERMNALKVQAVGSTLKIAGNMDLFDCFRLVLGESATVTSGALKASFEIEIACEGKDVSTANGKTLAELGGSSDKLCADVTVATLRTLSSRQLKFNFTTEGKSVDLEVEYQSATGTASLAPCTRRRDSAKQLWTEDDGCIDFNKGYTVKQRVNGVADSEEGIEDLRTIAFKGLVGKIGDFPWFEAGTASYEWNGWTGVVTYAGANTPPKFTIEKDGQKTDHSFPPVSAAAPAGALLGNGSQADAATEKALESVAIWNERLNQTLSSLPLL